MTMLNIEEMNVAHTMILSSNIENMFQIISELCPFQLIQGVFRKEDNGSFRICSKNVDHSSKSIINELLLYESKVPIIMV